MFSILKLWHPGKEGKQMRILKWSDFRDTKLAKILFAFAFDFHDTSTNYQSIFQRLTRENKVA